MNTTHLGIGVGALALVVVVAIYVWYRLRPSLAQRLPGATRRATREEAIDNTLLLIAYASRTGKMKKDTKDIAAVVAAKRAEQAITAKEEEAFWLAASSISEAVAPVTIESIISTSPNQLNGNSEASKAARWYKNLTLVMLFALLLVQVYWLIGATVVTDLKDTRVQLEKLNAERHAGLSAEDALKALGPNAPTYQAEKRKFDGGLLDWHERLHAQKIIAESNFRALKKWNQLPLFWQATQSESVSSGEGTTNRKEQGKSDVSSGEGTTNRKEQGKSDRDPKYFLWCLRLRTWKRLRQRRSCSRPC